MSLKKIFLPIFFSLISIYAILNIFHSSISFDWTFEDWLINYEGGFVRRGLSGEIISRISNFFVGENKQFYFDIQIHFTYFYILSILCLIFYVLLFNFLKKEKLNVHNLFIILSPLSISFIIYNYAAIGRKEILFFISFLVFLFLLSSFKKKELSILFIIFLLPFILLIHEGLIFFISSFLIICFFQIDLNNKKFILSAILLLVLFSFITFILTVIFKGNSSQVEDICMSLANYPINDCSGFSAIHMLSSTATLESEFNGLLTRVFRDKYLFYYPFFAFISFLPLIVSSSNYYFDINFGNKVYKFNFTIIGLIFFVNSLPLYIFTHDWGRWLHIKYILLMITFFYLKRVNKIYPKNSRKFELITDSQDNLKKILLSIVLIFYSAGLSVSYFGGYPHWILNYTTMDDQFKFYFNVIKMIPNLF